MHTSTQPRTDRSRFGPLVLMGDPPPCSRRRPKRTCARTTPAAPRRLLRHRLRSGARSTRL
eukprot:8993027-Alexandrium_andersonii.AAC.1